MEKRSIKIDLITAKEWYKKGNDLREIALQAFTEKELTKIELPKTWEEYCHNYPKKLGESFIENISSIYTCTEIGKNRLVNVDKNLLPSKEAAEAHLALMQLHQLRDCYRQGWVPNWNNGREIKWCIEYKWYEINRESYNYTQRFLSFQSIEIRDEFLKNFYNLIEKAKDLI